MTDKKKKRRKRISVLGTWAESDVVFFDVKNGVVEQ